MKPVLGWGERVGEFIRLPRLYYAVLPFAIPLIFATARPEALSSPARFDVPEPRVDLTLLTRPSDPLPPHSLIIPVRPGDTLGSILRSGGLTGEEAESLIQSFSGSIDVRKLRLNDVVRFRCAGDGTVEHVAMKVTGWGELIAKRNNEIFEVAASEAPAWSEEIALAGEIDSSVYDAVRLTGESPELVQSLIDVFQWDIDFFALRKGDRFSLVIEKRFKGDDPIGYGPILAARFIHRDETFDAYQAAGPDGRLGYYTGKGTPVKKQFLKAPLRFSRITSGFARRRFHPILGIFRPHHGVDYGAPVGTPVMSTADGVVTATSRDAGEGNFVRIRHNSRIQTSYLHLSRFARGIRPGVRVSQGDVIGYVGATGLATGPHLDYRVSDGGTWLDPLKLKSITPDPLQGESLRRFRASVARYSPILARQNASVAQVRKPRPALF